MQNEDFNPFHLALYLLGGACCGVGLLSLYWAVGRAEGPLNHDLAVIGWTAVDDIRALPSSDYAIPLVVIGVLCLIVGNATAWKETDGY